MKSPISSDPREPRRRPPPAEIAKGMAGLFGLRLSEEPHYAVVLKDGPFEIRKYRRYRVVRARVAGNYADATREAFAALSDYLFGENREHERIAMTIPVLVGEETDGWTLSLILPAELPIPGAPHPIDSRIRIEEVPGGYVAAFHYSGDNTEEKMRECTRKLYRWLDQDRGFHVSGSHRCALYDPPHAISFLKRNEIQVPVTEENPPVRDEGWRPTH